MGEYKRHLASFSIDLIWPNRHMGGRHPLVGVSVQRRWTTCRSKHWHHVSKRQP